MLEFLLYAMRNPKVRARAREFGLFNRDQIVAYLQQLASENGEELPLPIEDLAGIFGTTSDGFAQATLIDPDVARLFGLTLDLLVRGIRSYATDPTATATAKPRAARTRAATTRSAGRRDRG
jgi:hypothetical protein